MYFNFQWMNHQLIRHRRVVDPSRKFGNSSSKSNKNPSSVLRILDRKRICGCLHIGWTSPRQSGQRCTGRPCRSRRIFCAFVRHSAPCKLWISAGNWRSLLHRIVFCVSNSPALWSGTHYRCLTALPPDRRADSDRACRRRRVCGFAWSNVYASLYFCVRTNDRRQQLGDLDSHDIFRKVNYVTVTARRICIEYPMDSFFAIMSWSFNWIFDWVIYRQKKLDHIKNWGNRGRYRGLVEYRVRLSVIQIHSGIKDHPIEDALKLKILNEITEHKHFHKCFILIHLKIQNLEKKHKQRKRGESFYNHQTICWSKCTGQCGHGHN